MPSGHGWFDPIRDFAHSLARQARAQEVSSPVRRAIGTVALILIGGYLATAIIGGGDAHFGRVEGGRYFMRHDPSAAEHEVGAPLFVANLWLFRGAATVWAVGMVAGIGGAVAKWLRGRPPK